VEQIICHKSKSKGTKLLRKIIFQSLPIKLLKEPEVLILLLITVCYFVVNPIGEYAIDDDWAYVKSLHYLYQEGNFKIMAWNPMSLISLLLWGLPFTKLFGFTFTVTKISVVALLYLECITILAFLRKMNFSRDLTLLVSLTLIFNPIHFFHSFMFGTDIPMLAWGTGALFLYLSAMQASDKIRQCGLLISGSMFGTLSFLVRQNGILFPLAFFLYLALWAPKNFKSLRFVTSAFAIPIVVGIYFQYWYTHIHGPTEAYLKSRLSIASWLGQFSPVLFFSWVFFFMIYIGFFIAPVALSYRLERGRRNTSKASLAFIFLVVFVLTMFVLITFYAGILFPYFPNKLTPFGFLSPNEVIVGNRPVLWGIKVSWAVSLLSILAVLSFAWKLLQLRDRTGEPEFRCSTRRLMCVLLMLQLGYLFATAKMLYDRHLLILLPTVLLLFASTLCISPVLSHWRVLVLTIPLAIYSIAGTHDLHAVSRAAFSAGERLMASGIDPMWIDGGLAFDGWQMYERSRAEKIDRSRKHDAWWVRDLTPGVRTHYVISLSPGIELPELGGFWRKSLGFTTPDLRNYDIYETTSYRTYWPFQRRTLFIMKERVPEEDRIWSHPDSK
jgi:hypothetical protein